MKHILAAFVLLSAVSAAPARAQDFFGISPSDAQNMIAQAKIQEHEERLRNLGWEPRNLPTIGQIIGWRVKPASRQDCIYNAVAAHLGSNPDANVQFPDVLYGADTDVSRFQAAYRGQFPSAPVPASVQTVYMPGYDVIYVDDASGDYTGKATIDAAMAGAFARFIDGAARGISDQSQIDADASAVQSWYQTQYPAGTSSCGNN